MATYEHNALMQYIDATGNIHINYPATKAENVIIGNSDLQTENNALKTEIAARAKTSDVLYTLEEISACTDFTNKISGAEAVNELSSEVLLGEVSATSGTFRMSGDKKISDFRTFRFALSADHSGSYIGSDAYISSVALLSNSKWCRAPGFLAVLCYVNLSNFSDSGFDYNLVEVSDSGWTNRVYRIYGIK